MHIAMPTRIRLPLEPGQHVPLGGAVLALDANPSLLDPSGPLLPVAWWGRDWVVTTDPTLADGRDNLMIAPALGLDGVVSYSIDGSGNDRADPARGEAGSDEVRLGRAHFAPGSKNTPVAGPNPRVISNTIFAGDANANDPGGRSAYLYAFGQFIDHDIDLTPDQTPNGSNTLSFTVPPDDAFFAPGTQISIVRGQIDPANGRALNAVTSYLDLSQVYGSDAATAASLRQADGTLKTSAGGNLPVVDGQFAGGDVRAAENPDLTSIAVLFVREHNFWVATLHAENPHLTGDQLYDMARSITTAEYQNIVYAQYLPALLGRDAIGAYRGYDPHVSTAIFEEFSTAAFRFGHSIVSSTETKIGNDGTVLDRQDLIAAAGEATADFSLDGGADALLRNLAQDFSQAEGVGITSDLLNLLDATPPGDFGDLGAIDVERERDLGIGTLNATRVAMGMKPYTGFDQITSNASLAAKLAAVYGDVGNIDLFVGGLAEDARGGSMVGPTFRAIIAAQFENLRAGDRLFYENQGFSPTLMKQIEDTTLSDLIVRDTDTTVMQSDAMVATVRHASDVASSNAAAPQLVIGIDADGAVIAGEAGVDNTIVAGAGLHQVLSGGGSSDHFVFLGGGHVDTVVDFRRGLDTLDFEGLAVPTWFRNVAFSTGLGGAAVVQVGGNTIRLAGIGAGSLTAADFRFNVDNPALLARQQQV